MSSMSKMTRHRPDPSNWHWLWLGWKDGKTRRDWKCRGQDVAVQRRNTHLHGEKREGRMVERLFGPFQRQRQREGMDSKKVLKTEQKKAENGNDGERRKGMLCTPSQRCGSMRLTVSVVCYPFFMFLCFYFPLSLFYFVCLIFCCELEVHCLVSIVDAGHAVLWRHYCVFDREQKKEIIEGIERNEGGRGRTRTSKIIDPT